MAMGIAVGQYYTTYRSYDILDFKAETLGLSVGTLAVAIYRAASQKW